MHPFGRLSGRTNLPSTSCAGSNKDLRRRAPRAVVRRGSPPRHRIHPFNKDHQLNRRPSIQAAAVSRLLAGLDRTEFRADPCRCHALFAATSLAVLSFHPLRPRRGQRQRLAELSIVLMELQCPIDGDVPTKVLRVPSSIGDLRYGRGSSTNRLLTVSRRGIPGMAILGVFVFQHMWEQTMPPDESRCDILSMTEDRPPTCATSSFACSNLPCSITQATGAPSHPGCRTVAQRRGRLRGPDSGEGFESTTSRPSAFGDSGSPFFLNN